MKLFLCLLFICISFFSFSQKKYTIRDLNDLVYETDTHYGYSGNYTNFYNYKGDNIGSKDPEKNDLMKIHKNYYVLIFDYQCHYYDKEGNFIGIGDDVEFPCRKD